MLYKVLIWLLGYRHVAGSINFDVFRDVKFWPFKIEAVLNDVIVIKVFSHVFVIVEKSSLSSILNIAILNSRKFPDLIGKSKILNIRLLPWDRNAMNPVNGKGWRCCVITDRGQIYHNFPNRKGAIEIVDGIQRKRDVNRWDESVVWDLPNRRFPSKHINSFPYIYNPFLPDEAYIFHPAVNNDNGYGHGGHKEYLEKVINGKLIRFPRFYIHKRSRGNNPFSVMSGFEISHKLHILGSYGSNVNEGTATRICVFATSDGGRQWFNKYEFSSNEYQLGLGNPLKTNNVLEAFKQQSFFVIRRFYNYPTLENKEPGSLFKFDDKLLVNNIVTNDGYIELTTHEVHNFSTGDIVIIKQDSISDYNSSIFNSLCNNESTENSGGNGIIWRVRITSDYSFILHEYIHSPYTNITARHIHSINRIKDGFIIGTGDLYPQGWIFYFQVKNSDTYDPINAWDDFDMIRLTSSKDSIQRTLGTILYDDKDQSILFASDEAHIPRLNVIMPLGRTTSFSRSSTGVFKGILSDIDCMSHFECVLESEQPAYFFKEKSNMLIYTGQQNEIAISTDKGASWFKFNLTPIVHYNLIKNTTYNKSLAMQHYKGIDSEGRVYIEDLIIVRK